ncbi:hypothetical protein [Myceligenerans salitolerans]|uniref:Uncharacterized protein n=1 Tax=Myceligenerans salitolerans TaxID=1230528 RepID=A0ABS3I946_9MICO|nr:hypothetical protein [Myceligenerans salitolerans]MBO0609121.1 hypothetical protein [Myceligenerans salitolerans]
MIQTARPLVFLDVDGAVIPLGAGHRAAAVDDPAGWRSGANPQISMVDRGLGARLLGLSCELVWATAWGEDANEVIAPVLALPRLAVVDFDEPDLPVPAALHWKTQSLVRHAAGRPFVWLDDEIRDFDRQWIEAAHPAPALLHQVRPTTGITGEDLAVVAAWVEEVVGPPVPDDAPAPLRAIMDAVYDYDEGRGVDFEPYPQLEPAAETGWWFRLWTGNPEVTGQEVRPFGMDRGGGYVASWMIRDGADLAGQPVVYIGSEGDVAILAADAWDALWYFAHGLGLHDVQGEHHGGERFGGTVDPHRVVVPHADLMHVAMRLAPERRRPADQIIAEAADGLPRLREWIDDLCR